MRELNSIELSEVQGGCIVETGIIVGALALATAGVYLFSNLIKLYMNFSSDTDSLAEQAD